MGMADYYRGAHYGYNSLDDFARESQSNSPADLDLDPILNARHGSDMTPFEYDVYEAT